MSRALIASCAPTATTGVSPARPERSRIRFASARLSRGWSENMFAISDLLVELSVVIGLHQLDDALADQALRVHRHGPDVRCEDDVVQLGEAGPGPLPLDLVYVEGRPGDGVAPGQSLEERGLVDHAAAGDVDQQRARLHPRQGLGPDQVS